MSIIAFAAIAIATGRGVITPTAKSIGFAFKKSIYLLALVLVTGAFAIGMALYQSKELLPDWLFQLTLVILLCLVIGVFEEGLSRGIVLSFLLVRLGNTRRGLVGAVVVSSLIFGVLHVASSLLSGQVSDGLGVAQAVLKTVQSASSARFGDDLPHDAQPLGRRAGRLVVEPRPVSLRRATSGRLRALDQPAGVVRRYWRIEAGSLRAMGNAMFHVKHVANHCRDLFRRRGVRDLRGNRHVRPHRLDRAHGRRR